MLLFLGCSFDEATRMKRFFALDTATFISMAESEKGVMMSSDSRRMQELFREAYRQQGTTLAARGMQKSSWMTSASLHR